MHLVALAWIYVVLMMAAAEATSPNGTALGAVFTLLLYGALPLGIVMYLLRTPHRRRLRRAREAAELAAGAPAPPDTVAREPAPAASGAQPDGGDHAAGDPVAPKREEP
jgi:hypothetical protein